MKRPDEVNKDFFVMCKEHEHGSGPWEYVPSAFELFLSVGPYLLSRVGIIISIYFALFAIFGFDGLKYASAILLGPLVVCSAKLAVMDPSPSEQAMAKKHERIAEERERIMGKKDEIAEHLAQALRFKTISFQANGMAAEVANVLQEQKDSELTGMREHFKQTYPMLHEVSNHPLSMKY